MKRVGVTLGLAVVTSSTSGAQGQRLTNRAAETRFVDSLLARMTLAEKLGQLNQVSGAGNPTGPGGGERAARMDQLRHGARSEEHTSELQSRFDLVCRLLLEKKKKYTK